MWLTTQVQSGKRDLSAKTSEYVFIRIKY